MLDPSEKAYCLALESLERKHYLEAKRLLEAAAPHFRTNREFGLLYESTTLLCVIKDRLAALETEKTNER